MIYTYFRVPEPQGRSFAELDLLFERGVSARKFSSTKVDVFGDDVDVEKEVLDGFGGRAHGLPGTGYSGEKGSQDVGHREDVEKL